VADTPDLNALLGALCAAQRRQAALAELGARAIDVVDVAELVEEAVALVQDALQVEHCAIVERIPEHLPTLGIASAAIRVDEESAYGWLIVSAGCERFYTADELCFVRAVARIVAAAIKRCRADAAHQVTEAELRRRAFYDGLTNLPNRALFEDRLRHALVRSERERTSVAVLYVDLDGFKTVNDALGHAAGDDVLRHAADRLRHCVREGDTAARLGGDEFAIVLDGASDQEAVEVAARVGHMLEAPMDISGRLIQVGASVGIAAVSLGASSAEALIGRADAAMYASKQQRRARVAA
jgi:diguanylate cyclase (GGDEF)-like protein